MQDSYVVGIHSILTDIVDFKFMVHVTYWNISCLRKCWCDNPFWEELKIDTFVWMSPIDMLRLCVTNRSVSTLSNWCHQFICINCVLLMSPIDMWQFYSVSRSHYKLFKLTFSVDLLLWSLTNVSVYSYKC